MPAVWFANPVMLGGLGLAALPILIHLLYRRRPVAMDWGAMRYLRLAAERQTRRMRLEQWLLLMLRCLIIAFAVLATAQPYWEAPAAGGAVRRPQFHVLVVDCSLSVRAVAADGRSVFAHVRDAAVETLDRGGEADRWCLVRLDARRPLVLVDAAVASAALVRRTLEELKPGYGTADVLAALRETVQLLRQAPKGFDRRVTVISDFQRTGWAPSSEEERRRLASLLADLERHAGVALRPVSAATAENLAIVDWYARRPLLFSGRTAEVAVRLANHSGRPRKAVPVRLRVGEQWQPAASVDVPAEGTADAVFRFRVSDPGPLPLRAEVPEDVLPADNVAFAVLRVQETARVLIVDGRFGEPPQRRSAFFVRQALEPLGEAEPVSPYRVTVIADSQLPLTDLASFDAVVVCDVPLWTETEVERLRRYVLSGGALITSLGSDTDAGNANRHLSAGDPPLLGGRILQRRALVRGPSDDSGGAPPAGKKPTGAADPTAFLIGPVLWDHPVFDPLRGNDRSGLTTVVVLAYWKVRPEEQSEVLIRLLNDDPLLIVRRAGRGRIATLTCGLDPASTTWPVWGSSFVPVLHELLGWCIAGRRERVAYRVGETLVATLRSVESARPAESEGLRLVPPEPDPPVPVPRSPDPELPVQWSQTGRPGFYRLETTAGDAIELFGVNVDPRDSDLADGLPDVRRLLRGVSADRARSTVEALPEPSTEAPFPWMILLTAAGLLVVEQLVRWDVRYGVIGLSGLLGLLAVAAAVLS